MTFITWSDKILIMLKRFFIDKLSYWWALGLSAGTEKGDRYIGIYLFKWMIGIKLEKNAE